MRYLTARTATAALAAATISLAGCGGDPEPDATQVATDEPQEPADDAGADVTDGADGGDTDDVTTDDADEVPETPDPDPATEPDDEPTGTVATEVAPLDEWVPADQLAGEPLDDGQVEVLHPPGAEVVQNQEAHAANFSVVSDLVIDGLEDAEGVFHGYLDQLLEDGWEYVAHHQDGPTEVIEGDTVGWTVTVEDPSEQIEVTGGTVPAWELQFQASHDGTGATYVKLWHTNR